MSRAHPIGLRIASKKLEPSFIGVGQFYSYNQLKYNIVINKSIKQLSKQLAVPTYQIVDHFYSEKKNSKNPILCPNMLPMSVRLKAKQLFDSQYVLNRRRLYSVAVYTTRLLKQQFEKNYGNFMENTYAKPFFNEIKHKSFTLGRPVASSSKYQKWKSTKLKFGSLCPSITFARAFFRISQKSSSGLYGIERNLNTQNQKMYRGEKKTKLSQQTKQSKNLRFLLPTTGSDPYLMLSYGVFEDLQNCSTTWQKIKEFNFLTKKTYININNPNVNDFVPLVNNCMRLLVSPLALNCKVPPIFTLEKPKSKHLKNDSRIVSKANSPVFRFAPYLGKNKNLNIKGQGAVNVKKYKGTNSLVSINPAFYSFFFQYLTYIKQNHTNTFAFCPEWPIPTRFFPIIASINHTNWQRRLTSITLKTKTKNTLKITLKKQDQKHLRESAITFFKNQSQYSGLGELYNKPKTNLLTVKRFVLLNYLGQLSPVSCALYQKLKLKKNHGPTVSTSLALAKEVGNKQKRLYINSAPINKEEVFTSLRAHEVSYISCPRSSAAIFNLKSIKKLTKQIENFHNDIKLLAPLGLLLHRSFSEPVGINCISAVNNRLGKTYCSLFLRNRLFKRMADNFLKSNYMNSQIGLLRVKSTILFDFAYTKNSLIKLGLKKTNTLMQQLLETGHTRLWLRKLSSIRL